MVRPRDPERSRDPGRPRDRQASAARP